MKAKLIKDRLFLKKIADNYTLHRIKDGILTIEGDSHYTIKGIHPFYKLSLKNCQAIERGYDLDELAREEILYNDQKREWWKAGFQKALELMGDKKFSEEDMLQAFLKGVSLQIDAPAFQQSLQQTEWNVEIVMDMILVGQCDCPCHSDGPTIMHFMACCHPKMVESPKLDADGCLILKRK